MQYDSYGEFNVRYGNREKYGEKVCAIMEYIDQIWGFTKFDDCECCTGGLDESFVFLIEERDIFDLLNALFPDAELSLEGYAYCKNYSSGIHNDISYELDWSTMRWQRTAGDDSKGKEKAGGHVRFRAPSKEIVEEIIAASIEAGDTEITALLLDLQERIRRKEVPTLEQKKHELIAGLRGNNHLSEADIDGFMMRIEKAEDKDALTPIAGEISRKKGILKQYLAFEKKVIYSKVYKCCPEIRKLMQRPETEEEWTRIMDEYERARLEFESNNARRLFKITKVRGSIIAFYDENGFERFLNNASGKHPVQNGFVRIPETTQRYTLLVDRPWLF